MPHQNPSFVLDRLFRTIQKRQGGNPETSWTARLFARGRGKICQKLGEESTETIVAALSEPKENVVKESADLLYHLLVLWADVGVKPKEVWAELRKREGVSGLQWRQAKKKEKANGDT